MSVTHRGGVKPYGNKDLGKHLLRSWFVAWLHQATTWTNISEVVSHSPEDNFAVNAQATNW